MAWIDTYKSTPIGSLILRPQEEGDTYINQLHLMPPSVIRLLMSTKTGAYIRGTLKEIDVPVEKAPAVAYTLLQVAYGKTRLAEMSQSIVQHAQVPADKSEQIAKSIERDLLAPVSADLNAHLRQQDNNRRVDSNTTAESQLNTLDLTQGSNPPKPPAIPPTS